MLQAALSHQKIAKQYRVTAKITLANAQYSVILIVSVKEVTATDTLNVAVVDRSENLLLRVDRYVFDFLLGERLDEPPEVCVDGLLILDWISDTFNCTCHYSDLYLFCSVDLLQLVDLALNLSLILVHLKVLKDPFQVSLGLKGGL